jgi:hypothetical protein
MKSRSVFSLAFFIILAGCGLLDEKSTNITLKPNGLTATQGDLMAEKNLSTEAEFPLGTELDYILKGVTGYSLKDDKALFGCSMTVTDQSNSQEILNYADLFSESGEGYSKEDAGLLTLTLSIGYPMKVGHSYRWNLRVWDKRGKGELIAEITFKVSEGKDLVGIKTENKGLKPSQVYILSNGPIQSTDVRVGQRVSMIFTGVEGYTMNPDSTAAVGAYMTLLDKDNAPVLEYSDLFQNYQSIPIANATTASVYLTAGDPMKAGQTYLWKVRLWDKSNQNSLESSISITVKE